MTNPNRVRGGTIGKLGGHAFEYAVARHLGLTDDSVDGGSKTKVDIRRTPYGNLSLKNPGGVNTQVFLTTPPAFLSAFSLPTSVVDFIDLFFGQVSERSFLDLLVKHNIDPMSLHPRNEYRRWRVTADNIPPQIVDAALDWFNTHQAEIFDLLFAKGPPAWRSETVDTLGWATTKDDPSSVNYYSIEKMRRRFLTSSWMVSPRGGSTLWCMIEGRKLLHLQMKGSGKPKYTGWGYHGLMFHMHSSGLFEADLAG